MYQLNLDSINFLTLLLGGENFYIPPQPVVSAIHRPIERERAPVSSHLQGGFNIPQQQYTPITSQRGNNNVYIAEYDADKD